MHKCFLLGSPKAGPWYAGPLPRMAHFFVAVSNGMLWGQAGELEKQCTC